MIRAGLCAWLGLGLGLTTGCFEDTSGTDAADEPCIAGEQRNCDCPGMPAGGVQVCDASGAAFGACQCDAATSGAETGSPDTTTGAVTSADADSDSAADSSTGPSPTTAADGSTVGDTGPDGTLVLYATNQAYLGDFTGALGSDNARTAGDVACEEALRVQPLKCSSLRAVIGVNDSDTIAGFQDNFLQGADPQVVSASGATIAPSWSSLMAPATLENSLVMAGVVDVSDRYWTGVDSSGDLADNCEAWTDAENAQGGIGDGSSDTETWMAVPMPGSCSEVGRILCACW